MIDAYRQGETPETIVRWFDSLQLADVYAVITYYLRHREEVEDYLRRREEQAAQVRRTIDAAQPARPNFREELLARRADAEKAEQRRNGRARSLRSILEDAHKQFRKGQGIPEDRFWREVEQARGGKPPPGS